MSTTEEQISILENKGQNDQSNNNEKEIYFILSSEEKINLNLLFPSEISPQLIYKKSIEKGNGSFLQHNVFKLKIKKILKKKKIAITMK